MNRWRIGEDVLCGLLLILACHRCGFGMKLITNTLFTLNSFTNWPKPNCSVWNSISSASTLKLEVFLKKDEGKHSKELSELYCSYFVQEAEDSHKSIQFEVRRLMEVANLCELPCVPFSFGYYCPQSVDEQFAAEPVACSSLKQYRYRQYVSKVQLRIF